MLVNTPKQSCLYYCAAMGSSIASDKRALRGAGCLASSACFAFSETGMACCSTSDVKVQNGLSDDDDRQIEVSGQGLCQKQWIHQHILY